ncbi:hypothetical protein OIU79_024577, partial [Salix purpurea]
MGRRWRMKEKLPWVAGRWWWFTVGIRRLMKLAEVDELKAVTTGLFPMLFWKGDGHLVLGRSDIFLFVRRVETKI